MGKDGAPSQGDRGRLCDLNPADAECNMFQGEILIRIPWELAIVCKMAAPSLGAGRWQHWSGRFGGWLDQVNKNMESRIGVRPSQVSGIEGLRVRNWLCQCRVQSRSSGWGETGFKDLGMN